MTTTVSPVSAEEILSCPFCGSENVVAYLYGQTIDGEPDAFCQCKDCTATGPNGASKEEAIAAWNRRAPAASGAVPTGWKPMPPKLTPAMIMKAQLETVIGTYITENWAGAYGCLDELYAAWLAASPVES